VTKDYIYTTNNAADSVSGFEINEASGVLTPVPGATFASGDGPQGIAAHPSKPFLFVTNYSDNTITVYAVAANGSLSPIAGSPYATGTVSPIDATVTADGKYLYIPHYTNASPAVTGWVINQTTGALSAAPGSPFTADNYMQNIVASAGGFLYSAAFGGTIRAWSIDSGNGALSSVAGSPFSTNGSGGTAKSLHIHPTTGRLHYPMATFGIMGRRSINGSGVLGAETVQSNAFKHFQRGCMTPDGNFMYVTEGDSASIESYGINPDGSTTFLNTYDPNAGGSSEGLQMCVVHSSGSILYSNAMGTSKIYGFSVAGDGSLVPVASSPWNTGTSPAKMAVIRVIQ
jgi:6-phosphogluconolactonase (cycloisomerase 2 family)